MKCCLRQRNKWCINKYDNTKQIRNQSTSEEEKLEETTDMTQKAPEHYLLIDIVVMQPWVIHYGFV